MSYTVYDTHLLAKTILYGKNIEILLDLKYDDSAVREAQHDAAGYMHIVRAGRSINEAVSEEKKKYGSRNYSDDFLIRLLEKYADVIREVNSATFETRMKSWAAAIHSFGHSRTMTYQEIAYG